MALCARRAMLRKMDACPARQADVRWGAPPSAPAEASSSLIDAGLTIK